MRPLDSPYVFIDKHGKRFGNVVRSFKTASDASQPLMAGVDLTTVKELPGHNDITMTLRYVRLAPSHKRKAVEVLEKYLDSASQKVHNLWW